MDGLYSLEVEAFSSLVLYGALALVKTVAMSVMTGYYRKKTNAVATIEDAKLGFPNDKEKQKEALKPNEDVERTTEDARLAAPNDSEKQKKLLVPNENVERVRRAHLNDLENVVPFVIMGLLYVSINPNPATALWHFRIFLASRVLHSIVYVNGIRQPMRALSFAGGILVFMSMAFQTIAATYKYL